MFLPPCAWPSVVQVVMGQVKYHKGSECENGREGDRAGLDMCHQPLLIKVILRCSNGDLNTEDTASAVLGFVNTDLKASCPLYNPRLPDFRFVTVIVKDASQLG